MVKPYIVKNPLEGIDMFLENISGTKTKIFTGEKENSLIFWEYLSELCKDAICELKTDKLKIEGKGKGKRHFSKTKKSSENR